MDRDVLDFSVFSEDAVHLEKYGRANPFLDALLIPCHYRARVFVYKKEVFYLRNIVWKASRVKQIFQSRMIGGEDAAKEVWIRSEIR